ncbi:MAG: hypothetical protein LBP52_03980 [Burkholderiaceae bacterium]|nr:hypothetical protein [Burkholderiaceae bacterium]
MATDALTAANFVSVGVGYDIMAVRVLFKSASKNNILFMENSAKTRAAQAFLLFDELANAYLLV